MKRDFRGGLTAISAGYVPSGIAFGAIATALHVPVWATISLSALVYSGAVQSAFVGFWSIGIDPATLLLTAFLLNLRHTFYGPHVGSIRNDITVKDMMSIAPILTDEVYALSVQDPPLPKRSVRILSLYAYGNWISATAVGSILVNFLPAGVETAIAIALPALFLALLLPKISDRSTTVTAAASIAVSVAARALHLPSYFIIVPILVGVASGMVIVLGRSPS